MIMEYIKKTICLLLICLLLFVMASCGSAPQESETVPAPAAADDTEKETKTEQPAETDTAHKWEPQLSDEDKAIIAELGTLTHHTKVTEDTLTWSFDVPSGILTISGSGPMKDYSKEDPSPCSEYRDAVTRIVVEEGVTTIGAYAFYNLPQCVSAQLPDSVEYIGDYAFSAVYNLADVPFTANLREIADHAFAGIMGHKAFVIPEGVEIIGKNAFVTNVFYDTISIPASAYYIEETAFSGSQAVHEFIVDENNPNYTAVDGVLFSKDLSLLINYPVYKEESHYDIPDTVTRIGDKAIMLNCFLKTLTIPASVNEVGEDFIRDNVYMEEYIVDENCPVLTDVDGVLYSKDMKILYDYPCHKVADEYTVPASVETINTGCFSCCKTLEKLYVPGTVKTVQRTAFGQFFGELYLAKDFINVEIGNDALWSETTDYGFDYFEDLKYTPPAQRDPEEAPLYFTSTHIDAMTVFYEGTQGEWDAFVERSGSYLGDTVVICDTPFPKA